MVLVRDALHATGYAQDTRVLATGWRGPLLSQDRPQTGRNEKQDIGQQSLSQNELSYSKLHANARENSRLATQSQVGISTPASRYNMEDHGRA